LGERTRIGLAVLGAALALGGLGDMLLRKTPWGINLPLSVAALAVCAVGLSRLQDQRPVGEGRWLVAVAVLFAGGVALRDSPVVVVLDVSMTVLALSLAALRGRSGALRQAGVSEYVIGTAYAGAMTVAGVIPAAVRDIRWREVAPGEWQGQALAVARGGLIATPLLLIFGTLLVAADAVFEDLVFGLFELDPGFLGHLFLTLFVAWATAGFLTFGLLGRETRELGFRRPEAISLGIVEVGVALGLLNVLFLAFVAVQAGYLFGGAGRVVATAGLTYAEYARRGFFELVAVTALVIPVLLLADWLLRVGSPFQRRVFCALSGTTVALLSAIVASALYRMYLYQQEFGLTVSRVCATAFMVWLAFVLLWFALTVLRGERDRFAFGTLVAGFATAVLLNAVSPDALVARVNIERLEAGERFDPYYLAALSADAVPVLVESFPDVGETHPYQVYAGGGDKEPTAHRGPTLQQVVERRWKRGPEDWRSWNLARIRAERLVENAPGSGR
jgi:hypothetical protein